jgi:rubrerythrin
MSCAVCGKGGGVLGGNIAFTCPICKAKICKECASKIGEPKTWGGVFGDKHAEVVCPNCGSSIRFR